MAYVCATDKGHMLCGRIISMTPGKGKASNRLTKVVIGSKEFNGNGVEFQSYLVEFWNSKNRAHSDLIRKSAPGDFIIVQYEVYNGRNICLAHRRTGTINFIEVNPRGRFPMTMIIGEIAKVAKSDNLLQAYIPMSLKSGTKWYRVNFWDSQKFHGASRAAKLLKKGFRVAIKGTRPKEHVYEDKVFHDINGERIFLRPPKEEMKGS